MIGNEYKGVQKDKDRGSKAADISQHCSKSYSTVNDAFKGYYKDGIFSRRYDKGLTREKISQEEILTIKQFNDEECPYASEKAFRLQLVSDDKLYQRYEEFMEEKHPNFQIRCNRFVWSIVRQNEENVRKEKTYYEHFGCDKCKNYDKNCNKYKTLLQREIVTDTEKAEMQKLKKSIDVSEMQAKYGPIQQNAFRKMREQLTSDNVIIIQDFIKHYPYVNGVSKPVIDMVLVLLYLDKNGDEAIEHLHIMSAQYKNNHQFVVNAWLHIITLMLLRFQLWDIWSDGSAKEFKCRYIHAFYSWLQTICQRDIAYHFYTSNHAHNMADGSSAVAKKQVKLDALARNSNPQNPEDYAEVIHRTCKNMTVYELTNFVQFNCNSIVSSRSKGIKQFHSIKYVGLGKLITSNQTYLYRSTYHNVTNDCIKQDLL